MPFYQIDFFKTSRYITGVDAPSLEVAEFKAEQLIPLIKDSDWRSDGVDFAVNEYEGPTFEEGEETCE